MSGLFATLAAAAHGDAEALRARPRGRFEPEAGALPEMMVEERSASEETGEEQPHRPAPRAPHERWAERDDGKALSPKPLMPRAPVAANPQAKPDTAERPDLGQQDSDQPRRRPSRAEPSERTGDTAKTAAPLLRRTARVGEATNLHTSRDDADASTPARRLPDDTASSPLLPLVDALREEPDDANSSPAPKPQDSAIQRTRGQRSLSIGRIEVRPPPPAPPPPTPQASYRATIIPRAQPRQSLDEYRRRGR